MKARKMHTAKVHDRRTTDLPINAVVAPEVVDDPYEPGAKITVVRSLRDDPLAGLFARGFIDAAQLAAGRKFQYLHELATLGVVRAIDPTKERVDGGRLPDMLSDRQIAAFKRLADAYKALHHMQLMFSILISNLTIAGAADSCGMSAKWAGKLFKDDLERLAELWDYA